VDKPRTAALTQRTPTIIEGWETAVTADASGATDGESGVAHVLSLLRTEFEWAMALCGVTSVDQVTRPLVRAPWLG